ncbi:PfaB family protein [Desulfobacterales bacterium HSG16]|nr:PfaB family protein [Desulfobacterales bacterium HSG16]
MNKKLTIVGMEIILGSAIGLDIFERNIYDGIPISEQERMSGQAKYDVLDKMIYGAIKDTRSKVKEETLADTALILVADENYQVDKEYDCKIFSKENSLPKAFEKASEILTEGKANSVILAVLDQAETAYAAGIMLKFFENAKRDQNRIYAAIDVLNTHGALNTDDALNTDISGTNEPEKMFKNSFESAHPFASDYIEIAGMSLDSLMKTHLAKSADFYKTDNIQPSSCALGSSEGFLLHGISENMTHMAGIIKTALCLYHRYIPGNFFWKTPENFQLFEKTPFYIPTNSRTWFLSKEITKRKAGLFSYGDSNTIHMILSEDETLPFRSGKYLAFGTPFCFPIAGDDENDLLNQIERLNSLTSSENDLQKLAKQNFDEFNSHAESSYALMLVADNREGLQKEIKFVSKRISSAFADKSEVKTPRGSYFTANPLGKKGKVVFVYPGVGSAYLGLAQDIFHMFPGVYDQFSLLVSDVGKILKEKELYPRTCHVPAEDELKNMERAMRKDVMDISECGISFSVIYTMIMAGYFNLFPEAAIGYSMGETSMMASLMIWKDPGQLSGKLKATEIFSKALHGELTAVRKEWGLPDLSEGGKKFIWESYTLLADRKLVEEAVEHEDRVYLTLINTDNEVVIAGDPDSCIKIAEKIGCKYFPLRLDLAIHSKPAWSEYDNIVDLFTLPTEKPSGIKFYSSSCYMPLPIRSKAIANSIARAFCDPVDFPKLVQKAHDDEGRIFIEAGPRQTCSLWIEEILKGQEFAAVPLNIKGTRDQVSFVRALAQLVSHRVNVDIKKLFLK